MLPVGRIMRRNDADANRHVLTVRAIKYTPMLIQFLQDALFSAIAAIGFSAISNPPRRAIPVCALIAATGHSLRFLLMQTGFLQLHIVTASTIAAALIGTLAVIISPKTKIPAETYLYPSLLPMIPGIYAYRTFGAMVMCLYQDGESGFNHYFHLFATNGMTCFFILLGMAVGATLPMFLMKDISFQATRHNTGTPG